MKTNQTLKPGKALTSETLSSERAPAADSAETELGAVNATRKVTEPDGPMVLVVDDDPIVLKATEMRLKALGFRVATAPDGPAAIHAVRTDKPDVILLDLSFPPDVPLLWDGFAILTWLQRMECSKDIPVILFTGNQKRGLEKRAQDAGAAGLFYKPLNFNALVPLIQFRLRAHR